MSIPSTNPTMSVDGRQTPETKSYPASVHFAFVGGLLLPLAAIPYLLSRRQTFVVRNRLQEAERVLQALQQELKATTRELQTLRSKQTYNSSQIKQLQGSLDEVDQRSGKFQADGIEGQKALLQYVVELERDLESSKTLHGNSMREVGRSLGSVAAFMHELELGLGMVRKGEDPRGIERLRAIAAKLQQGVSKADK